MDRGKKIFGFPIKKIIKITHKESLKDFNVSKDTITNIEMNYDVFFHDYHKTERKNRKLGHMTHTCATRDELEENIEEILKLL